MITKKFDSPFFFMEESVWPFSLSISLMLTVVSFVLYCWKETTLTFVGMNFLLLIIIFFCWEKDVNKESNLGNHTKEVETSLQWSICIFILSEFFFFLAIFSSLFFFMLTDGDMMINNETTPSRNLSIYTTMDFFNVPLLTISILLASSTSVTWAHHSLVNGNYWGALQGVISTILLGFFCMFIQYNEYWNCIFSINDSLSWGSTFYVITGFHWLHILIGIILLSCGGLSVCFQSSFNNHMVGFEMASWAWHVIDVLHLLISLQIYWVGL